jgi:TPP-dependent indolepyruvate ferredoxin oxidoreductase alpha subunit
VELAALVDAAGVEFIYAVDPLDHQATETALETALAANKLAVVVAQRACPEWEGKDGV